MANAKENLLVRLHKWAWRQDENFLTEVLAHLLQHLLDQEPEAAVGLLRKMTDEFLKVQSSEAHLVEVRTQIFGPEGTPDLELRTAHQLAFVEVKSESDVHVAQLKRYRKRLQSSGFSSTALILLTRYPVTLSKEDEKPDAHIRWYKVAEWLEQESSRYAFKAVSAYLVDQFLSFLGARNMTMEQVTWELPSGVRALRSLCDMLYEVANLCGCHAQPGGDRRLTYMGVHLEKRNYWLGILYDQPGILWFETNYRNVDKEAAERLGIEGVSGWESGSGHGWSRQLDLESEEIHFFARSKASQMQVLENFLNECLATVRQIELPHQNDTTEETEEAEESDTE